MTTFKNIILDILIPAMWLAWLAYWIYAAASAKKTRQHEPLPSRITHNVAVLAGAIIMIMPFVLGDRMEQRLLPYTFASFVCGAMLVAIGLAFAVAARVWLGTNWSGTVTVKQDHELIRSGPYAYVRHPIYTGLLLALIGTAVVVGNGRGVVALALLLASFVYKLRIEERFMRQEFGGAYERYCAEVKALVPFVV